MPTKPQTKALDADAVKILNTIRDNASNRYIGLVPQAEPTIESIRGIGAIIVGNDGLANEFLSALVNRIGMVIITSKMYTNPWSMFKRGMMEMGEVIEEIFVNIAKPHTYDAQYGVQHQWDIETPDVKAAFHVMNYEKFYKQSVFQDQLRRAFLSWDGVSELIMGIINSMYTAANYDEFQTMKYMLASAILRGDMYPVNIPAISSANMTAIVSTIKGNANNLEFMSNKYNKAGVMNFSNKADQILIINTAFDAQMSVEVLATAFNEDRASFMGRLVLIDGFGNLDTNRLNELFSKDPTYVELTETQLEALNTIPAVCVDKDYFMIFDNMYKFTEKYNGESLYWNYFYHVWKTFSLSPFANAVVFTPTEPTVTSVTVTPAAVTLQPGTSTQLTATVVNTGFAPKDVTWASNNAEVEVGSTGKVNVLDSATGTAVITATSTFDNTISGSATITIQIPSGG